MEIIFHMTISYYLMRCLLFWFFIIIIGCIYIL